MKVKLCSCLTEKTINNCIKEISKIKSKMVEHRIDYLNKEELNKSFKEIYSKEKEFIATCRNKLFNGMFEGSEEERIELLIKAVKEGANYIDIEIETNEKLKKKVFNIAKENNCKIIISKHDFEKTPNKEKLNALLEKEINSGADIGKIVTMTNSKKDAHRILELILKAKEKRFPLVAFGMGEKGTFSRAESLVRGSPFTFVSNNKASAPGQIDYTKMKKILEVIK